VEYSLDVMERVREHVLERFYSIPRGGAEAGGVLFGKFVNGQIRILAARPATCEYAKGPTFTLSPRDEAAFKGLLFLGDKDGLAGMRPVGWYRSRTRSEPCLAEEDVGLWKRFFPHAWQLAVVLCPASVGVMRAALFFREADGSVRTECVYPELQLLPREISGEWQQLPRRQLAAEPEPRPDPLPVAPEAIPRSLPPRPKPRARRSRFRRRGLVAALIVIALGVAGYSNRDRLEPLVQWWQGPPVNLRMQKEADGIMVRWDPHSGPVQRATGGTLHVEDDESSSAIPLGTVQLRSGFAAFRTQSSHPRPRLILRQPDGQTVVEVLRPVDE
jgi:hypothetical protein